MYYFYNTNNRTARYEIDGSSYTAKSALKQFPRLIGLLQNPKKRIKTKSLDDKFRLYFKTGKFKPTYFSAPLFYFDQDSLEKTFQDYVADDPIIENYLIPSFFDLVAEELKTKIQEKGTKKTCFNLKVLLQKINDGLEAEFIFYSGIFEILSSTNIDEVIQLMRQKVAIRLDKLETAVGSGWTFVKILSAKLRFAHYKPLNGTSLVELPSAIKNKNVIVSMKNKDNECFKLSVTRALFPVKKDQERITKKLREQSKLFDRTGVNFPTSFEDISKFEENNDISIKVLGCDKDNKKKLFSYEEETDNTSRLLHFFILKITIVW